MLEHHDRVVVAHRALEQALGVVGRRRRDDLQARHVAEERLQALRVLRAARGRTDGRAHHHRHLRHAARHVGHLGCVVDELIHRQEQEVGVLHVGDGAQAGQCRADRDARQPQLGDRGVEDPLVAEFIRQAQGHSERPAEAAGDADVLADAEDEWVAPHFFTDALADRLSDAHLGHGVVLMGSG